MNANLKAFMLTAILVASIGMTPAFGQILEPITVTTDKASYSEGETIMVTGIVRDRLSGVPVSLTVIAPNGNLVAIQQPSIGADKEYSAELVAGGPLMKSEGTYTVVAQYGNQSRVAETTFEFGGSTMIPIPGNDEKDMYTVMIEESEYSLDYSITGGSLVSIVPNMDDKSLIITIESTEDGSLTITLPRSIIDAMDEGSDGDTAFLVLVDREEQDDVEETKTEMDRTLTIQFPAGAEEIEIIGTWIVPEFGTIAVMILVMAIVSIIAISAKSRLSIMPRY